MLSAWAGNVAGTFAGIGSSGALSTASGVVEDGILCCGRVAKGCACVEVLVGSAGVFIEQ